MFATTACRRFGLLQRYLPRATALFSVAALVACQNLGTVGGRSGPEIGQIIDPGQTVQVALLVPGGTGSPNIDKMARSLANAARMAVADAQGASIDLKIYDTAADSSQAAEMAIAAADAGAKIIIGPLYADSANAVGNAMKPRNINVLAFSNNTEIAGSNVFTLGTSFANVANRLVGYGVSQGKRNIYVVAEDDIAGQLGGRAIETAIANQGARLAGRTNHAVSISGVDSVVPQIAAAAQSGQVDAVFMTANNQAVLPYLTGQLAEVGVTSQVTQFMGLTRWDEPRERLSLAQLQNGWFAIPDQRLIQQFQARYQATYGEAPHELASLAYDGVSMVAAQLRAGKRNALTSSGLTQSSGFAGVGGSFRLRGDGTAERGLAVATIRGNQLVILDQAPRSFRGAGF